jgi:uncharacterized membrane protein
MNIMPRVLFVALLVLAPAIIWGTSGGLPDRVATHFGADGLANGWMSRDGYRTFMLVLGTVMPILIVVMAGLAPQFGKRLVKLPDPDYWLAPERRALTLASMFSHACWLGSAMLVFFTGMHLLLLRANAAVPPRLPESAFFTMMGALVIVLIVWTIALRARFRRAT